MPLQRWLQGDGENCRDIDECAVDNGGCDVNTQCQNTAGSRECRCNDGYAGDGERCKTNLRAAMRRTPMWRRWLWRMWTMCSWPALHRPRPMPEDICVSLSATDSNVATMAVAARVDGAFVGKNVTVIPRPAIPSSAPSTNELKAMYVYRFNGTENAAGTCHR